MMYDEFQAMERFGMSETQFYMLSRETRARMIAYLWIGSFQSTVYAWENSRKAGKP